MAMPWKCFCFDYSLVQHVVPLSMQLPLAKLFLSAWAGQCLVYNIDIKSLQNRLLKVCCVLKTSTCLPRLLFIFLLWPITVLIKQTRQAILVIKQSIFLRCLWSSKMPHSGRLPALTQTTRVEKLAKGKHSSLLRTLVNYEL
jgi:hypothetical protein